MERREFSRLCGGLVASAASLHLSAHTRASTLHTPYPESQLVYDDDSPVTLQSLERGIAYVFGYPYVTTPCFLVRLKRSSTARDSWPGGLGSDQSVVAFSAICSHKMSHPAKPISHIAYRNEPISFYDSNGKKHTRDGIISCCSERSVYDPASACDVLAGPAPVPLAAITLAADDQGNIRATDSFGDDQYERFLTKFGFRLSMEYGVSDIRARSGKFCKAIRSDAFSAQQILC